MVSVNDLEDVSEMGYIQLLSDSFRHLPGFARVGHRQHNNRGQEPLFNLQGVGGRIPEVFGKCLADAAGNTSHPKR